MRIPIKFMQSTDLSIGAGDVCKVIAVQIKEYSSECSRGQLLYTLSNHTTL